MTHNPNVLQSVIQSTTEVLPDSKPRFIHGIYLLGQLLGAFIIGSLYIRDICYNTYVVRLRL